MRWEYAYSDSKKINGWRFSIRITRERISTLQCSRIGLLLQKAILNTL